VRRNGGMVADDPTQDPQWGLSWLVQDPSGVIIRLVTVPQSEGQS
jgi:predicted enzyme related to lactoylglutathione lyase